MSDARQNPALPPLPTELWEGESVRSRSLRQFHDRFGHLNNLRTDDGRLHPVDMNTPEMKEFMFQGFTMLAEEFHELAGAIFGPVWRRLLEVAVEFLLESNEPENLTIDSVEVIDALTDISYLVEGRFVGVGVPSDAAFDEVHASNMSKLGADGKPIYREDGKILKGPNYCPPNLAPLLNSDDANLMRTLLVNMTKQSLAHRGSPAENTPHEGGTDE
jgi:hypothetical protein